MIATVLLSAILFSIFTLFVFSEESIGVSAKGAALYCPETKSFLYEKNGDIRYPMASTTKIMTALIAAEEGELDRTVVIPKEATGIEGSSLYLREGERLTLMELIYGLMLRSANDAAAAIAIALHGSVDAFTERMNARAEELLLTDTHFDNPHGLDGETHYTTAKDLARLGAAALANETVRTVSSTYKKTIGEGESRRLVVNHNKLLRSYEGAIGLKTGFTKKCGRCLVGAAERDGVSLVSTTLSAPDDWADHKRLLDYGFSSLRAYADLKAGDFCEKLPVLNGRSDTVTVQNREAFLLVEKRGLPDVTTRVCLNPLATAPIAEGDILGKLLFIRNGQILGSVSLYAMHDVPSERGRKKFFFF